MWVTGRVCSKAHLDVSMGTPRFLSLANAVTVFPRRAGPGSRSLEPQLEGGGAARCEPSFPEFSCRNADLVGPVLPSLPRFQGRLTALVGDASLERARAGLAQWPGRSDVRPRSVCVTSARGRARRDRLPRDNPAGHSKVLLPSAADVRSGRALLSAWPLGLTDSRRSRGPSGDQNRRVSLTGAGWVELSPTSP